MQSPTFEIVTMTPEWAAKLLGTINTHNRKLKPGHVKNLSEAIIKGDWKLTSHGISIGSDGALLDGQHRLAAIVKSKKNVQVVLSKNCDPSTFSVIDTGARRSAGDAIALAGGTVEVKSIAAGLRLYICATERRDRVWHTGGGKTPSNDEILRAFEKKAVDAEFFAAYLKKCWSTFRPLNKSASLAFCLLAVEDNWSREDLQEFFALIASGAGLSDESPILAYRNWIASCMVSKEKRRGQTQQGAIAALTTVFNNHHTGVPKKKHRVVPYPPMPKLVNKIELGLAPEVLKIVKG